MSDTGLRIGSRDAARAASMPKRRRYLIGSAEQVRKRALDRTTTELDA